MGESESVESLLTCADETVRFLNRRPLEGEREGRRRRGISRLHSSFCIQKTDAIRWNKRGGVCEEATREKKKKREQIILILSMKLVGALFVY